MLVDILGWALILLLKLNESSLVHMRITEILILKPIHLLQVVIPEDHLSETVK